MKLRHRIEFTRAYFFCDKPTLSKKTCPWKLGLNHNRTITIILYEPLNDKTSNLGFRLGPTQNGMYSHRSRLEKLEFSDLTGKGIIYPCSENIDADQLCNINCTADLCLCFSICRLLIFWCGGRLCVNNLTLTCGKWHSVLICQWVCEN